MPPPHEPAADVRLLAGVTATTAVRQRTPRNDAYNLNVQNIFRRGRRDRRRSAQLKGRIDEFGAGMTSTNQLPHGVEEHRD